ncbi:MAG: DUF2064 domain-containing protein [Bacteroidota bacterium]
MIQRQKNTAILLFSRTSADEAAVKDFAFGQKNQVVAHQLVQHSIKTAQQTKLPFFQACNKAQYGNSFGERLANEIEIVFQKGYESLIIIGNDCPQLTTQHIFQAKEQLRKQQVVLGPASDGGVYLIGLRQDAYSRSDFINFDWEKETLQESWEAQIADIVWLEILSDIDSAADLRNFLNSVAQWHYLRQRFLSILREVKSDIDHIYHLITTYHFNTNALRAPPSLH